MRRGPIVHLLSEAWGNHREGPCSPITRRNSPVRWSHALIPTLKETPADAVAPSHVLLLRAGMIRQLGAGAYSYLPLGLRVLNKVVAVVRQEMNVAGGQEVLMPALQPVESWKESGRLDTMKDVLMRLTVGRHTPMT